MNCWPSPICREIALAVDRLGWRAHVHAEHPLLPEAFDMTDAWIAQHDRTCAQRREADERASDILRMKEEERLPDGEIAQRLGVSPSRVGMLVRRARENRKERSRFPVPGGADTAPDID